MTFTPEEIAKLPKWAHVKVWQMQQAITALEMAADTLDGKLPDSRVALYPSMGLKTVNLSNHSRVRFLLGPKRSDCFWIDVDLMWSQRLKDRYPYAVQVRASETMAQFLGASNSLICTLSEFAPRLKQDGAI